MIRITSVTLLRLVTFNRSTVRAIAFGPFIIFRDRTVALDRRTNVHEMIHFLQQIELLFLPMWLLYIAFYLVKRLRGKSHWDSYRYNPFEQEAFDNEKQIDYLIQRKPYAWLKYLK